MRRTDFKYVAILRGGRITREFHSDDPISAQRYVDRMDRSFAWEMYFSHDLRRLVGWGPDGVFLEIER